jgi:hypothetical protein
MRINRGRCCTASIEGRRVAALMEIWTTPFDAVWRIIAAKPHGWSGLALTAFEIFSAEIR